MESTQTFIYSDLPPILNLGLGTKPKLKKFDMKTTSKGRLPLVNYDFSWEDDLKGKMTKKGRQPKMEDNLKWKTTEDGRGPQKEDNC